MTVSQEYITSTSVFGHCPFCGKPVNAMNVDYGFYEVPGEVPLRRKTPDLDQDVCTLLPCGCDAKRIESLRWAALCAWSSDIEFHDCFGHEMFTDLFSYSS